MKKRLLLILSLLFSSFIHAQNQKNEIEIRDGKVGFSDCRGLYSNQYSISYIRQLHSNIFIKGSAYIYHDEYMEDETMNTRATPDAVIGRTLGEVELGAGYRFHGSCMNFRAGAGILYRYRDEMLIGPVYSPIYDNTFGNTINTDFGLSAYGSCYIYFWKCITGGLYLDEKVYNKGVSSTSFGLQMGVTF